MTDDPNVQATQLFQDGLYCAEAVLKTLAERQGITDPQLTAMATGFCGGLSRTAGPCGAVTGAVMGLGLALGRSDASGSAQPAYQAVQTLLQRFGDEFGATGCAELLGCHLGTPEGRQAFNDGNLRVRCAGYTGRAAALAAEIIDGTRNES